MIIRPEHAPNVAIHLYKFPNNDPRVKERLDAVAEKLRSFAPKLKLDEYASLAASLRETIRHPTSESKLDQVDFVDSILEAKK